jgi:asparagine synthase (glutamine-hydrolysing)
MRLARENNVTVVLDGQGGDEALGGYHLFFPSHLADLARQMRVIRFWREDEQFRRIHAYPLDRQVRLLELLRPWVPDAILTRRKTKRKLIELSKLDWLSRDFLSTNNHEMKFRQVYSSHLSQHLYRFLTRERLPSLLRYEDRNSMAFSLEARVPFLDYRLIEFVFALPNSQKLREGMTKVVLRNAMKGVLPERVRQRVDKMGFVTPESIWFRTVCKNNIEGIINSKSFQERGYFNAPIVRERFNRFCGESEHDSTLFWRCVNLELWLRIFLD